MVEKNQENLKKKKQVWAPGITNLMKITKNKFESLREEIWDVNAEKVTRSTTKQWAEETFKTLAKQGEDGIIHDEGDVGDKRERSIARNTIDIVV